MTQDHFRPTDNWRTAMTQANQDSTLSTVFTRRLHNIQACCIEQTEKTVLSSCAYTQPDYSILRSTHLIPWTLSKS